MCVKEVEVNLFTKTESQNKYAECRVWLCMCVCSLKLSIRFIYQGACDATMYSQTIQSKYFDILSPLACGDTAGILCAQAYESIRLLKRSHELSRFRPNCFSKPRLSEFT